jgi:hypothetical protein
MTHHCTLPWWRTTGLWLLILACAVLNGALREGLLRPGLGGAIALPLSGLLLMLCILALTFWLLPHLGPLRPAQGWAIGLYWLVLTLTFEFGLGHFVQGRSMAELLAAYTFAAGNLWPLVLLATLLAPPSARAWWAHVPTHQPLLLPLNSRGLAMKRVYQLSQALKDDPTRVAHTHALTLDASRPLLGLRGRHGLMASRRWWQEVARHRMPLQHLAGQVLQLSTAGQDPGGTPNTLALQLDDGTTTTAGIYLNEPRDLALFAPGHRVELVYALDELKAPPTPHQAPQHSRVALEMTVSLTPGLPAQGTLPAA